MVRWVRRILGGLVVLIVVLVVVGTIYQAIGAVIDARKYPPPGKLVDVGGYRLHINCVGQGNPTVVMDTMGGGWSVYWSLVQPEVATFTQVCTYDRAGYGWSDAGPTPRTGQQIATELHTLLSASGLTGPYVLVGHSLGGFTVRLYRSQHPQEVAGMVLVDAGHEDELAHPEFRAFHDLGARQMPIIRGAVALGVSRLAMSLGVIPFSDKLERLTPAERTMLIAGWLRPRYWKAVAGEIGVLEETCSQVRTTDPLGDLPLVVLTATGPTWWPELPPDFPVQEFKQMWLQLQNNLTKLSKSSTQLFAEQSSHFMQFDQPQLIVEAIRQVVETARQKSQEHP